MKINMGFVCGDNCKIFHQDLRLNWLQLQDDYELNQYLEDEYTIKLGYCPSTIIPGNASSYFQLNTIMDSVAEKVASQDLNNFGGKFSLVKYSTQISLSNTSTSSSSVVDKCSVQAWLQNCATMEQECENEDCLNSKANSVFGHMVNKMAPYLLPCISLLTCLCLVIALGIFGRFRGLWCERVRLQCHLMAAMLLRSVTSTIRHYFTFYRRVEWICKALVTLDVYAQCAVVAWTFVQGIFLHNKITRVTRMFREGMQQKLHFLIGWGFPIALVTAFSLTMEIKMWATKCWGGYEETGEMQVLAWFLQAMLIVNIAMLLNIIRILITKGNRSPSTSEAIQFRRSVQATFILTFLHCVYYLPILFSADGSIGNRLKSICISSQGIYIAIMLCFFNKDVHMAIFGMVKRFWARQVAYEENMNQRAQVPRLTHRQMTLPPFFSMETTTLSDNKRYSAASTVVAGGNDEEAGASDENTTLI